MTGEVWPGTCGPLIRVALAPVVVAINMPAFPCQVSKTPLSPFVITLAQGNATMSEVALIS